MVVDIVILLEHLFALIHIVLPQWQYIPLPYYWQGNNSLLAKLLDMT
jgi:hypothetical protein